MSIYIANTQAIIHLLEAGIISQPAFDEVYQQTRCWEDDEDIADAIDDWLRSQNDPQLMQAYREELRKLIDSSSLELGKTLGPGKAKSPTKLGQPNPNSRELLDNIITKRQPLADDSTFQAKPNS